MKKIPIYKDVIGLDHVFQKGVYVYELIECKIYIMKDELKLCKLDDTKFLDPIKNRIFKLIKDKWVVEHTYDNKVSVISINICDETEYTLDLPRGYVVNPKSDLKIDDDGDVNLKNMDQHGLLIIKCKGDIIIYKFIRNKTCRIRTVVIESGCGYYTVPKNVTELLVSLWGPGGNGADGGNGTAPNLGDITGNYGGGGGGGASGEIILDQYILVSPCERIPYMIGLPQLCCYDTKFGYLIAKKGGNGYESNGGNATENGNGGGMGLPFFNSLLNSSSYNPGFPNGGYFKFVLINSRGGIGGCNKTNSGGYTPYNGSFGDGGGGGGSGGGVCGGIGGDGAIAPNSGKNGFDATDYNCGGGGGGGGGGGEGTTTTEPTIGGKGGVGGIGRIVLKYCC